MHACCGRRSGQGEQGASQLERLTYEVFEGGTGGEVVNLAALDQEVVSMQIGVRRGRWRSRFSVTRQDASTESVDLQAPHPCSEP